MRIMAQPPFPQLNVESRTQMTECKLPQNKRGFVTSLSVYVFCSTLWWGKEVDKNKIICFANPRLFCRHRTQKKNIVSVGVCKKRVLKFYCGLVSAPPTPSPNVNVDREHGPIDFT